MTPALPRALLGAVVVLALTFAMRALSLWPVGATVGEARIRLSWSARPERIETCRTLTDAELAELPSHMRMRVRCEGAHARYALSLTIDSSVVLHDIVRGGGLRNDRPMYLLRELGVVPGTHRVQVALVRADSVSAPGTAPDTTSATQGLGDRSSREADERRRRAAEALPPKLQLDTTVAMARGQVVIVTYREQTRRLEILHEPKR